VTLAKIKKTVRLEFGGEAADRPVLYPLSRQFEVVIVIREGSLTEGSGFLLVELEGEGSEIDKVLDTLRGAGCIAHDNAG